MICNKELLCTLGPSSMNDRIISRLESLGVDLFRINLSHTRVEDVDKTIRFIQERTNVPVCLDTEGAQIRTGSLKDGSITVKDHTVLEISKTSILGDENKISFYPDNITDSFELGDFISIDFNSVFVQVIEKNDKGVVVRILNGGLIGQNKAVTVERDIEMPVLTRKDIDALKIGNSLNIAHTALSFANRESDVDFMRSIVNPKTFVISKIECLSALKNLDSIIQKSDAILIDRGDLSRQVAIEQIPRLQKYIISKAEKLNTKVYVATNLLESMISSSLPTRAEVNDVINTLIDGADGLVLAAETAIGHDPVGCANMITKLINEFTQNIPMQDKYYPINPQSFLINPHGGRLIHQETSIDEIDKSKDLKKIKVSPQTLIDCEQIGLGAYSPLSGFMDKKTLTSVLKSYKLPSGVSWTMPITLQIDSNDAETLKKNSKVILTDDNDISYAYLEVGEVYKLDLQEYVRDLFGTDSREHHGVSMVLNSGEWFVGGKVTLIRRISSSCEKYQLTPSQARFIFTRKGWNRVLSSFDHKANHGNQDSMLSSVYQTIHADGIYLLPASAKHEKDVFSSNAVLENCESILKSDLYSSQNTILGYFPSYRRFAGPREAVFTAICRKNMGCSHFVISSSIWEDDPFYNEKQYRELFEVVEDLEIAPIFFSNQSNPHYANK